MISYQSIIFTFDLKEDKKRLKSREKNNFLTSLFTSVYKGTAGQGAAAEREEKVKC